MAAATAALVRPETVVAALVRAATLVMVAMEMLLEALGLQVLVVAAAVAAQIRARVEVVAAAVQGYLDKAVVEQGEAPAAAVAAAALVARMAGLQIALAAVPVGYTAALRAAMLVAALRALVRAAQFVLSGPVTRAHSHQRMLEHHK
jgi:hypothetical protein